MNGPETVRRRHVLVSAGPLVVRAERRSVAAVAVLGVLVVVGALVEILAGDYTSSVGESLAALFGLTDDPTAALFVQRMRLPRAVAAAVVGAALGVAGAIFQSVSGNPLGSPDIVGFTVGSATGALLAIVVADAGPDGVALGAVLGGFGTALVVYGLAAAGRRTVAGTRLVLVGVGVGATLSALNALLVVRASLDVAQTAAQWLAGSLNAMTWERVAVPALVVVVVIALALLVARPLALVGLGDDVAGGIGVRPTAVRGAAVAAGVALVSVATATAGPIAFVALAAPQLARRLTRTAGVGLVAAAAMGALLVVVADLVAQRLFAPTQLPVGVVTGSVGGLYLIWLLSREWRR